jgi:hypothetical protein
VARGWAKASAFHCTAVYLGFANIRIIQNFIAVNAETDSTKRIQLTTSISCRRSGCCGSPKPLSTLRRVYPCTLAPAIRKILRRDVSIILGPGVIREQACYAQPSKDLFDGLLQTSGDTDGPGL